ncbi:acyl- dehydrogenase protein [Rutstroemia sp. NJR-2017a BBW]|nr:acyl- dehydrogenase protein [Rutstroemia sp. NJR-2017a BBW]
MTTPTPFFRLPAPLLTLLSEINTFIETDILPLQHSDDNNRFFDHRREYARTDWENGGTPRREWEELLEKARVLADGRGFWRYALPEEYGGRGGGNLNMAVLRMRLAGRGLGLNEWSIVGNFPDILMVREFGTPEQKQKFIHDRLAGKTLFAFGLTEPSHGSDATHMSTAAVPHRKDGVSGWLINGEKMWISGMHRATHCLIFARTSGKAGDAKGITAFFVESNQAGFKVEGFEWTFNMPTDHARLSLKDVFVSEDAILGEVGEGLSIAQCFVHENRLRQAASSLGAAQYCINQSILYARQRTPFGKPLASNQAIQFPIVELSTQCEMLELLILKTASEMDACTSSEQITRELGHKVSMCNYWANRLCCEAADRAMQIHGGMGYSRRLGFEHIFRHHRRYRITEGAEEIQMRKIAGHLFGYMGAKKAEVSKL